MFSLGTADNPTTKPARIHNDKSSSVDVYSPHNKTGGTSASSRAGSIMVCVFLYLKPNQCNIGYVDLRPLQKSNFL